MSIGHNSPACHTYAIAVAPGARWRAALCSALVVVSCVGTRATAPDLSAGRRYAMVSYNGLAVPADIGVIPPKGDAPGGCHVLVTAGSLTLDIPTARFAYSYDVRDACTRALLSQASIEGILEQHGRDLAFRIPRTVDTVAFSGTWESGVITVRPGGTDVLVFK